jgi:ATP-dependent Lon protease
MFVALVSLFTGRAVKSDVAMTGEISLRGRVLPVGGIKEKVLGAAAAGIKTVLLPRRNLRDLDDVPDEIRKSLAFVPLETVDDALAAAFEAPAARPARKRKAVKRKAAREPARKKQVAQTRARKRGGRRARRPRD